MSFDKAFGDAFNCRTCSKAFWKQRACKKAKRKPIIAIECICKGNKQCPLCNGSNAIKLHRCPRAVFRDHLVSRIAPYFSRHILTGFLEYPDGRGPYYQPWPLLEAFNVLLSVYNKEMAKHGKSTS